MESVYFETTIVSYLVSRPSRDILVAANQQTTHEWWTYRRQEFECYISQIVIDEIQDGDLHSGKFIGGLRMINDPIVNEVRRVRDELAKKFNYDVDAIFADLREKQKKYGNRIVNLMKQRKVEQASAPDGKSRGV